MQFGGMTTALYVVAAILGSVVLGFALLTLAINFAARDRDRLDTVSRLSEGADSFMRTLHGAAGEDCTSGNDVRLYQNGDEIFPPMLSAIRESRLTVHFSGYVFWSGKLAERFADAFCDAARRGVAVRLIVDSEGSSDKLAPEFIRRLRDAGCQFVWFGRAQWFDIARYDRRTHRRLLVIDGTIGFTGGAGIGDEWLGNAESSSCWRETNVRVSGPSVRSLQAGFTETWHQCTNELLLCSQDYPVLSAAGDMTVTAVMSSPFEGSSSAQRVFAACIAASTRTLRMTTAYLVPTPAFVEALRAARARGVTVQIIVPGPYHNKPLVKRASRHTWRQLLSSGVEIYEHQITMVHAKTIVVDASVSLVGSANFDPRSFSLNAECGIVTSDLTIAGGMERVFDADLAQCARVTMSKLAERTLFTRAVDALLYSLRAQL